MSDNFNDTFDDFNTTFRTKVIPNLAAIEKERNKLLKDYNILKILSVLHWFILPCFIAIAVFVLHSGWDIGFLIFFAIGFLGIPISITTKKILLLAAENVELMFNLKLKDNILPVIFAPLGNIKIDKINHTYFGIITESGGIGLTFMTPILFNDDVIKGVCNNKKILIAEGKLRHSCNNMPYHNILMIKVALNKNDTGRTILKNKRSKNKIDISNLEKIILEDVNIMENYDIYSTNQIESRCFLEPDLMDTINKIQKKIYAHSIDFILHENYFYIIINSDHNYFEIGSLYKKVSTDEWVYKNAAKEMYSIAKLINYFKFN